MDIIFFITLGFIFLLVCALISIVVWSLRNGIAPMPTSPKAKRVLLNTLPLVVQGPIYELGSGWGTLAFSLAKRYPHSQVIGFETSLIPYWVSVGLAPFFQSNHLRLLRQDFFHADLHDAALVICYLYPGAMRQLKEKFNNELSPGTWVVSNTFAIPGWQPAEVHEVQDLYHSKIFVYKISKKSN